MKTTIMQYVQIKKGQSPGIKRFLTVFMYFNIIFSLFLCHAKEVWYN